METRKWNPVEEMEGVDELMSSGAEPDEADFPLEEILKEYGQDTPQPPPPPKPEEAPEAPAASSAPPAQEPMDDRDTAAFIGQQVNEAIGRAPEEDDFAGDTTINGLREFFAEARRKNADKKLRREQRRRERAAAEAMAEAAAAMAETEESEREDAADQKVLEMPVSKVKPLRDSFGRLQDRANDFADNMYAEAVTAQEDSSRAGETGTDVEDIPEDDGPRRKQRSRRSAPNAPDTPADELASRYRLGLAFMRRRLVIMLALVLIMLYLSLAQSASLPLPAIFLNRRILSGVLTWFLALGATVGLDVMWLGLSAPFRGRFGMHTLSALAVLATLADGIFTAAVGRDGPLPCAAVALLSLLGAGLGLCQRKNGLQMACRMAASTSEPYRVTLDERKWNGVSAFCKEAGTTEGFGSQIQGLDGSERIYRIWTPLLLLAAVLCAVVSSVGHGEAAMFTWCLSVILTSAAPVAGMMAFGHPYLRLARRLDRSGAVLAGWDGVESMAGRANILIKDEDLYPEGSIIMKSIKHFEGISLEKLTGCTASMLRSAGTGLYHLFDAELRRQGGFYRRVDDLECYEAGGLSANIRGDQVLVGTHGFLTVMNIKLESGMKVRRAVYCVINKTLEGIFSLEYEMSHYAKAALRALVKGGVQPVLVTRDFNVIPSMLQTLHDLPVDQMEYPPIDRRRELSEPGQAHNSVLGALLTREGMGAYSDAVIGGRRLRSVVRLNSVIALLASLAGVILSFYLTWSMAFESLSTLSMLVFLLIWALPNLVISGAVDRF